MRHQGFQIIFKKKNGFKIGDRVQHKIDRQFLGTGPNREARRNSIGIVMQVKLVGESRATSQAKETSKIASIGEIIRTKLDKMAEGETSSGTV